MAAWNWLLMSLQNSIYFIYLKIQFLGDINEELSNEKKNEGYYSEDFAYKYIKVNLHDRIEKGNYIFKIFFIQSVKMMKLNLDRKE